MQPSPLAARPGGTALAPDAPASGARFFSAPVVENLEVAADHSLLVLEGCEALEGARPGQFAMLRGPWGRDPLLPRALSILGAERGRAEFLVKRVGRGSRLLGEARVGTELTALGPLGNHFPAVGEGRLDLLVAGGCGLPPLHLAARRAAERGASGIDLCVGARRSEELPRPLLDRLAKLGVSLAVITEDGSTPERGLVTDLLERRLEGKEARVFACGPEAMLRAVREVARRKGAPCWLSLEAQMACGLGACLGCAVEGRAGRYLHVCKDGPVFAAEEVWP